MKNKLDLAIKWLVLSSQDPNKVSLTLKAVLTGLIGKAIVVAGLVHFQGFDAPALNSIVDGFALVSKDTLEIIGTLAGIWGAWNKVVSTFKGTNAVVQAHAAALQ